jgi:8-oxo-dGTP pyrophosphatase MutT (NUDIX family)
MIQIAGGVVWNKSKGVVVVNQNHNSWSLPKGHVEEGEATLQAAIREIREESGIPEGALTLVGEVAHYTRKRMQLRAGDTDELRDITLYLFTTAWDTLLPEDPENPEALWIPPTVVPDLLTNPVDKSEFARIIASGIFNNNEEKSNECSDANWGRRALHGCAEPSVK